MIHIKSHYLIVLGMFLGACGNLILPPPNIINNTKMPPSLTKAQAIQIYETEFSTQSSYSWDGNITNCLAGSFPQNLRDKVLQRIKFYRKLVGLPTNCFFDASQNTNAQEAALMMKANNTLDHNPPSNWKCYSQVGASGANCCLAYYSIDVNPELFISQWIEDAGSNNTAVGHRVNIFSEEDNIMFGYGSTGTHAALCRDWSSGAAPDSQLTYIAYPPNGHIVADLVYPRWSFLISGADLSSADVLMKDATGNPVVTHKQVYDPSFRALVWEPDISTQINVDTKYTVEITGVKIGTEIKSYTYDVIIVKP